jgi:uncharacterized protein
MLPGMKSHFLNRNLNRWHGLIILLCTLAALRIYEHRCLYVPDLTDYPQNPLEAIENHPLKAVVQEVTFNAADKTQLNAWFVPSKTGRPTILFAHGNGGNIGDRYSMMMPFIQAGYGFLAFDYRGYGKSQGQPSEEGLYQDMEAASKYLEQARHIPISQQIAMGESLGTAITIHTAARYPYRAVILFSSMSSAPAVAEHLRDTNNLGWLGFLPLPVMMQTQMNALSQIGQIHSPILIMHGEADTMMPLAMPKSLYENATATSYKKLIIVPQAGHNDVFFRGQDQFMAALEQLLTDTAPAN